jgi:hypothetical protein
MLESKNSEILDKINKQEAVMKKEEKKLLGYCQACFHLGR